jgi:NAD(P)-dependent dehydrogenase (short-subunit alcohol dehydrogenase family)
MRTAIVTGAAGNLGKAVADRFLKGGYRVVGTLSTHAPASGNPAENNLDYVAVDLENEIDAGSFVKDIVQKHQVIDVAVLTVGGFSQGDISITSITDIDKQVKMNFYTTYNVVRPVLEHMKRQKYGRIFMVGSKAGADLHTSKGTVAYGLAKSLLFGLAELLNEETKGTNVVTSVIVPSIIDTPQNRASMPGEDHTKWVKADAIADVIYYYCTEEGAIVREPIIKVYGNS